MRTVTAGKPSRAAQIVNRSRRCVEPPTTDRSAPDDFAVVDADLGKTVKVTLHEGRNRDFVLTSLWRRLIPQRRWQH